MIRNLNWANRITLLRVLLIPVLVGALLARLPNWGPIWAAGLFSLLAATDAVDGYLARSRNEVTTFGKLIDPLADKLLVAAALVVLVELDTLPAAVALVIISREFIVTGLRMVAIVEGKVIPAGSFGKAKTFFQVIAVAAFIMKDSQPVISLGAPWTEVAQWVSWAVMIVALALTVYSMVGYFYHARDVITTIPMRSGQEP